MTELEKLRLDKWLWFPRFFKTRSLAKQAIEGGKVQLALEHPAAAPASRRKRIEFQTVLLP